MLLRVVRGPVLFGSRSNGPIFLVGAFSAYAMLFESCARNRPHISLCRFQKSPKEISSSRTADHPSQRSRCLTPFFTTILDRFRKEILRFPIWTSRPLSRATKNSFLYLCDCRLARAVARKMLAIMYVTLIRNEPYSGENPELTERKHKRPDA